MDDQPVQTRSEVTGIQTFETLREAMKVANTDTTIWKISFPMGNGERVRLIRRESGQWVYEPIEIAMST